MLAVRLNKDQSARCLPNILPCRINHNGRVNASRKYWAPIRAKDGRMVSYFRGRKLYGRPVRLPEGYLGKILQSTGEKVVEQALARDNDEDEGTGVEEAAGEQLHVDLMEEKATFQELMLWGHGALPHGMADPYVKGIEEWMDFAEQIHSWELTTANI